MYELLFEEQFTVFEMLLIQSPLIFHSSLLNVDIKSIIFSWYFNETNSKIYYRSNKNLFTIISLKSINNFNILPL